MSRNAKSKERRQRRRQERQRNLTRAKSGSPYRKIGQSGELVACYVNDNWRSDGYAVFYVLRRAPRFGIVMGAFFVDLWCAGLKDAWGRLDMTMEEFNDRVLSGPMADQVDLVRVNADVARRIVAGGIRFAQQNGFRLPPRYQRWTALLGDAGDVESADLSDFGVDGKLRWVGPMTDLKARLVGCSVDEFLSREDVEYIVGDEDFTMLDDSDVAVGDAADALRDRWLNAVRQWCFASGMQPHPALSEALDIVIESILHIPEGPETDDEPDDLDAELSEADYDVVTGNVDRFMDVLGSEKARELEGAFAQVISFNQQFRSSDELFAALAVDELGDEE
ncbi:MAG: hypothetical protein JXQ75_07255 [Phycisphaerae bacterium]|nr:hypothetical protein [Phycisphaerae bacterium]